jgi:hypothetical protein
MWPFNLFRKNNDKVEALALKPAPRTKATPPRFQNQPIKYPLNDPTVGDLIIDAPIPPAPVLSLLVQGYNGGGYDINSVQGQAAICYVTIANAMKYMISKSSPRRPIQKWAMVKNLVVIPRAGNDLNAYYDRAYLKFFYFMNPKTKKVLYTCQSADIVAHEFGHAFLDILRPDLFSIQSYEAWAFHESFGDITAILSIMQWEQVIDRAIAQTSGDLMQSNIISRLAEEMGQTIYELTGGKEGHLAFALRDAVNDFHYVEPEKLKDDTQDNVLSRECHNFSRVWTGAWYEVMVRMYQKNMADGMAPKPALVSARDTAAVYLLHASLYADTVRFFDAVARQMMHYDKVNNEGKYQAVMEEVFTRRNILRPRILMQSEMGYEDTLKGQRVLKVEESVDGKIVKVGKSKKMKLADKFDFHTLADDPLFNVNVSVPSESVYIFDKEDKLVDSTETTADEVLDSVYFCLKYLQKHELVGPEENKPFEVKDNELVRKHFVCRCPVNNACDPNAPEYGKPWKGENNAGCNGCKGKTPSCDCDPPPPPKPVKYGCYTSVGGHGTASYKVGSSASRKVC